MYYADGFDEAIIGVGSRAAQDDIIAYDYDKCIEILCSQGMEPNEAIEYFNFNVLGGWVGSGTPIFIEKMDKEDIEMIYEEECEDEGVQS